MTVTIPSPATEKQQAPHAPSRRRIPVWQIGAAFVVVAAILAWAVHGRLAGASSNGIAGSGTIETIQVDVAAKVSGRIKALLVHDGDRVTAGQPIAQIETTDALLAVDQAKANLDAARAQLRLAQASYALQRDVNASGVSEARAQVATSAVRVPQSVELAAIQAQSVSSQVASADAHVRAASAALETARATLAEAGADVQSAQASAALAQANVKRERELYRQGDVSAQQYDVAHDAALSATAQVSAASSRRDAAAKQLVVGEADLRAAHADFDAALAGEQTIAVKQLDVAASNAQLDQSKAVLAGAQAQSHALDQRRADVAVAAANVEQAQAALGIALRGLSETTLHAPFGGVILAHSVEVGNLVVPGTSVLTVSDLDHPYLDVYVSEANLARVKIGQSVDVQVDGAPGRIFKGSVTSVHTTAEFTPSNVQTKEQRAELVFRVRIDLPNPDGALKPGLPADGVIDAP
ncbi:MAG TPA: efflux RND transporter periplasmic adaptor subunit [Candidatus Eremiobacteraceae bacterium]|nr:efflux RND transporter periplasmic adaptor subunit [Candidatus Eremiobacteraceae bacterium]